MPTQLGIFAKHWTPGRVKTRLAQKIGPQAAAEVAKALLETLLARLQGVADKCEVGFAPEGAREEFAQLVGSQWRLNPQSDGDLGARMEDYFERAFQKGADRVVLLGADSPDLPVQYVRQAFERLNERELVLGPTSDGGYYLIGARERTPRVFAGMPWSSDQLWQATQEQLECLAWRKGREWEALPPWYDIDTIEDLNQLRANLKVTVGDESLAQLSCQLAIILSYRPKDHIPNTPL